MAGLLSLRFASRIALTHIKLKTLPGMSLMSARKISFRRKNSASAALEPMKTPYEVEYKKIVEKEGWQEEYGFMKGDPYLDKALMNMIMFMGFSLALVFFPMMTMYGPDFRHKMKEWRRYEAYKLIAEREANGEPLLHYDFVPADQIEAMVPPPGDWEREWLLQQPSVRSDTQTHFYVQSPTW